jgi:RNA polymerase sigma-32 factor
LSDTHAGPEDRVIEQQRQGYVQTQIELALASLNERERDIARARLMADEPSTLEELGLKYGISKERVRQIEVSVKLKLKKALAGQAEIFEG